MAAATTTSFQVHRSAGMNFAQGISERRHRITPEAGHALEILGHAIEYLADELVEEKKAVEDHDPRVEAIQLLMKLNRRIYFECPTVLTLRERVGAFAHRRVGAADL